MIKRYSRKELTDIWSEENKYKIWLDVEIAAAEAMEKYKIIPKGVASLVKKKGKIKVKRIHDIETKVKHDVIAFLTSITEQAGLKARYLHQGMTSSDVLDTTLNIQLVQSGNILLKFLESVGGVLLDILRSELPRGRRGKVGSAFLKSNLLRIKKRLDHAEHGGALLLGVNGICVIGHGSSKSLSVVSALRLAHSAVNHGVMDNLNQLQKLQVLNS